MRALTGSPRLAARQVHGFRESGIYRRPARQVRAGVVWRRAGRVALGARTGAVSCHSPLAGRLHTCGRQAGCFRRWRIGMGRGGKPCALGQARESSVVEFFPRHRGRPRVEGARPGGFGRSDEGFHVEQIGRIEPRASANGRSARGLWVRGPRDFRTEPGRRSRGPAGLRGRGDLRWGSGGEGPWLSPSSA